MKNRSIFYKERDWNDFHFYNSEVLGGVKIIQPSVYHELRGEISTTYHSDYYDRLLPAKERTEGLQFKHDRFSKSEEVSSSLMSEFSISQDVKGLIVKSCAQLSMVASG